MYHWSAMKMQPTAFRTKNFEGFRQRRQAEIAKHRNIDHSYLTWMSESAEDYENECFDLSLIKQLSDLIRKSTNNTQPTNQMYALQTIHQMFSANSLVDLASLVTNSIEADIVPAFIKQLKSNSNSPKYVEYILFVLAKIVRQNYGYCQFALKMDLLGALQSYCESDIPMAIKMQLSEITGSVVSHKKVNFTHCEMNNLIHVLISLMQHSDGEALIKAVNSYRILVNLCQTQVDFLMNNSKVCVMINVMKKDNFAILNAILLLLGDVLTHIGPICTMSLSIDILLCLPKFFKTSEPVLHYEAIKILSIIFSNNRYTIQKIIDADLVPLLFQDLKVNVDNVKNAAVKATYNLMFRATYRQRLELFKLGIIQNMCSLLSSNDSKPIVLNYALRTLEIILKMAKELNSSKEITEIVLQFKCIDKLKTLMKRPKSCVSTLAKNLMKKYFPYYLNKKTV